MENQIGCICSFFSRIETHAIDIVRDSFKDTNYDYHSLTIGKEYLELAFQSNLDKTFKFFKVTYEEILQKKYNANEIKLLAFRKDELKKRVMRTKNGNDIVKDGFFAKGVNWDFYITQEKINEFWVGAKKFKTFENAVKFCNSENIKQYVDLMQKLSVNIKAFLEIKAEWEVK